MSRIIGKAMEPENGYPWFGTVTLLKDATVVTLKNNIKQWRAFGAFERAKKGDKSGKTTVGMTTVLDGELAGMLIEWKKGTRLFVAGAMKKNEYRTQKNGKEIYELNVEYVHDQHDYHAAQNEELDREAEAGTDEYGNEVDAGF